MTVCASSISFSLTRACRGLTLLEVLVVVAIVTILIGITLPVMSSAKTSANRALCANNQRQLAMTARAYAADNRDYLGQADALDYRDGSTLNNNRTLPDSFTKLGFHNPYTRQPDHYLATGYLTPTTLSSGETGHPIFTCPEARRQMPDLATRYWQDKGNVESHYFYTTLLHRPTVQTASRKMRNNVWGPYKSNQISRPNQTFLLGDAMAYDDNANAAEKARMVDTFNWEQAGENSTVFGVVSEPLGAWLDEPRPYHRGGPNGLFYDGHVETVTQPTPTDRFKLRTHLTADATGKRYDISN